MERPCTLLIPDEGEVPLAATLKKQLESGTSFSRPRGGEPFFFASLFLPFAALVSGHEVC